MAPNTKRLPNEYAEVRYIQALDADSYVMSGITGAVCKSAYAKIQYVSGSSSANYGVFGAAWAMTGFLFAWGAGQYQFYSNGVYYNVPSIQLDSQVHEFQLTPTGGTSGNIGSIVRIFGVGAYRSLIIRIYHLIWYNDDGEKVAEFIPCYRISDNVCGFYNLITNTFQAGVGNFAYGTL